MLDRITVHGARQHNLKDIDHGASSDRRVLQLILSRPVDYFDAERVAGFKPVPGIVAKSDLSR